MDANDPKTELATISPAATPFLAVITTAGPLPAND